MVKALRVKDTPLVPVTNEEVIVFSSTENMQTTSTPDEEEQENGEETATSIDPAVPSFSLPTQPAQLQQFIQILKTHPGDQKIQVGTKEYFLSEEGIVQMRNILHM
jgi:hypothetical protein